MEPDLSHRFRIGEFEIDSRSNELTGPAGTVALEPLVMSVLVCLARRSGEVVPREVIIDEVWRRPTTDQVLDRCISELRGALGDDARRPRFVKTYPKSGYKLLQEPVYGGGWRVLVVDDEELVRHSFSLLLREYDDHTDCCEARSCEDAISRYGDKERFDLVFLDLGLPGVSGLEAIESIKGAFRSRIVVVSGLSDAKTIESALEMDTNIVAGYMPKLMKYEMFRPALDLIRAGGRYVPQELFGISQPAARKP
jgi:DNA-binding response OmpR family regulator